MLNLRDGVCTGEVTCTNGYGKFMTQICPKRQGFIGIVSLYIFELAMVI